MSTTKISVTSELMKNYKQATIMSPEKKFEALQTSMGNSMLFSIGTDSVFYLTQESPTTQTGWGKTDLSSALMRAAFPQGGATCKTFEAAQSAVDGTIGIAMAVNDTNGDNLFLCLGNSNADTAWTSNPNWVRYPYDNPDKPVSKVVIVNIEISETANDTQYIVVDILRDPDSPEQLISRYYIDTKRTNGYDWHVHDVSIDLEANQYVSCLGRQYLTDSPHQPTIDGLYTCGQVDGSAQFIFQPLYNVFQPDVPATSARLRLPDQRIPEGMASCRKSDLSTDLYVTSGDGLYYFASSNQNEGSTGVLILQNALFTGVSKMFSAQANGMVTVWGLNGNNQIFYLTCPMGEETSANSWSVPLPILTGVDMFSPYINVADEGNTFFAVSGNVLQKLVKSAETSLWNTQNIALPTMDMNDTQSYSSYTTTIQVTDENDQPVANTPVSIKANTRTGVYINQLYYVVDTNGITIKTDTFGNVTVIEWVDGLTGTLLFISGNSDGTINTMNPMGGPMQKVASLNTVSSLRDAVITNDDGTTVPLVSSAVSDDDLEVVAQSNVSLGNAYDYLSANGAYAFSKDVGRSMRLAQVRPQAMVAGDFLDAIWVEAGDLFQWLKSGVEAIVQVIEDAANKVWNFVVKIADTVYACVLDVVEKVVEAVVWVFNTIKTAIEDLIKFLQFLFGWQDILTTHQVMKNVIIQFSQQSIDNLVVYKDGLAEMFQSLQSNINQWAEIPDFNETPASVTTSNPPLAGQNSSPSNLGIYHFQGNVQNATSAVDPPGITEAMFEELISLMKEEGETLVAACHAIKKDIIDQINSLSMSEIIKRFMAILADTLLQTAENVMEATLDLFIQLTQGMMDLLTAKLDIPVLSWLYKQLTGEDLSFLDLICLIGAIPATIIYKISAGVTPFPQGDAFTEGLINAGNFEEVQALFYTTSAVNGIPLAAGSTMNMMAMTETQTPVLNQAKLKVFGFVTDIFAFVGSAVLIVATEIPRMPGPTLWPKTVAACAAVANIAYISPNIPTIINAASDNWYQQLNNALTAISALKGFVNVAIASASSKVYGVVSAFMETAINIVWNVPVIMNIVDNWPEYDSSYKSLVPESIGNFEFNFGGIMEFPIALTPPGTVNAIESGVQYGLMISYGICMPIAGAIYSFAENQEH